MKQTGKKERRRRYRLNIKRFASVMFLFVVAAAVIAIASGALDIDEPDIPAMAQNTEDMLRPSESKQTDTGNEHNVLSGRVIVVDAGHGGFDPGTIGVNGAREDVLNLLIAQQLKALLKDNGANVIMTRSDENALAQTNADDLAERRRIIEQSGADFVVSIHMNWYEDSSVCGPVVLFMPGSEKGKELAEAVQQSLNTALGKEGCARSENLYILKSGYQPSILVECGYLSNEEEERMLDQPDYQKKIAKAICEGVTEHLLNADNNQ